MLFPNCHIIKCLIFSFQSTHGCNSSHSKNGIVNIKLSKQIFYNVIINDMYQCKQWIQISCISYKKVYIKKFSYANFPGGGMLPGETPLGTAM